jgi:hypothetical protein
VFQADVTALLLSVRRQRATGNALLVMQIVRNSSKGIVRLLKVCGLQGWEQLCRVLDVLFS